MKSLHDQIVEVHPTPIPSDGHPRMSYEEAALRADYSALSDGLFPLLGEVAHLSIVGGREDRIHDLKLEIDRLEQERNAVKERYWR